MANVRTSGILNSISADNFKDKNGNTAYTGKVLVDNKEITISVFSKNPTQYPINIGQKMFFDIDWSEMKHNNYKGDYFRIFKVKSEMKEEADAKYSGGQAANQSTTTSPSSITSSPQRSIDKKLLINIESMNASIKHYINQAINIPDSKLSERQLITLAELFKRDYYNLFKDNDFEYVKEAMNQALSLSELNDALSVKINDKEAVISYAKFILTNYYLPELKDNESNVN